MAEPALRSPLRKKESARAKGNLLSRKGCLHTEVNPTFIEPDSKWVRTLWPSLPQHSAARINLTSAGLDKYLQTPLLPLDTNLLKHAVALFDGSGIPFDKNYIKIDSQSVSTATGLPASGDPVDMSVERRRTNPGGRAKVALEICGTQKAYGSKGIRVDLIKPVELRWAAAVLASRVFGQQKGEYVSLGHFNLVKRVSLGHRFNWAEFVAARIKEQLKKIHDDGKGCFYMGSVLSGLIYDQVPNLGPRGRVDLLEVGPSLMKWAALCPKRERGCLPSLKDEAVEYYPLDDLGTQKAKKKKGAAEIGDNSVERIVLDIPMKQKEGLPTFENGRPPLLLLPHSIPLINNDGIDAKEEGIVEQVSEKMSFRQLLEKQVMLSAGGLNAAAHMDMDTGPKDLGSGDRTLPLDFVYKKLEMKSPGGLYDEPSGMMETCSVSGTGTGNAFGSPSEEDSPKPKSSEVAQQLDSPINVRKHPLFGREEEISSKRMKALEWRPSQALPLQKMTLGENLHLFRSVFDELERRLQSANRDCEWWKSCMQELCKGLNQHFGGLPMKDSDWQDILNEEPVDSIETQQARAYMKKATKIIKEQDGVIQLLKDREEEAGKLKQEETKKLKNEILASKKDFEMEQERRKVAEVRVVNLENQLVQIKEKLRRVFED